MNDPDPRLVRLVATSTPADVTVTTGDLRVADALRAHGTEVRTADLTEVDPASLAAVILIGGELSRAGEHAEELLAAAASALRPGGLLVVAAANRIHAAATGMPPSGSRMWSAEELVRAVGHPGIAVEQVAAPGAAAALRGEPDGDVSADLDRHAGLLDAAPQTLVIGRRPSTAAGRTEAFFGSVPRKIVAAAVLCRDDGGRVLVVHDTFKGYWTIPGGIVDADEDPRSGAVREAYEEAGVKVDADRVLGVFSMPWPDRVLFIYGAVPVGDATPAPVHVHEVDDAAWLPLEDALARLNPRTADQVRRCLDSPGTTWADPS